jgi:hypothetical protein
MKRIFGVVVLTTALSASALAIAGDTAQQATDCPPGCCGPCPEPCETECVLTD